MLDSKQIDLVLKNVGVKRRKKELRVIALRRAILSRKPVDRELLKLSGFGRGTWVSLLEFLDIEQRRGIKSKRL